MYWVCIGKYLTYLVKWIAVQAGGVYTSHRWLRSIRWTEAPLRLKSFLVRETPRGLTATTILREYTSHFWVPIPLHRLIAPELHCLSPCTCSCRLGRWCWWWSVLGKRKFMMVVSSLTLNWLPRNHTIWRYRVPLRLVDIESTMFNPPRFDRCTFVY